MQIKIGDRDWERVVLFDPPSRTVVLFDGSVWHLASDKSEILELDLFMTPIIEKHAPWELEGKKLLALTGGNRSLPEYRLEIEQGDESRYEMFYFHKFLADETQGLSFPDHWKAGVCVEIQSAALRYFLADTLFFDFFISHSSEKTLQEVFENMNRMKKKWREKKAGREKET
jgi:hypothetical protein